MKLYRRRFVLRALGVLGLTALGWFGWRRWLRGSAKSAEFDTLTALADAIVPADEFPGAVQSGVPAVLKRGLAQSASRYDRYSRGLQELDELARAAHGQSFARLTLEIRTELLERIVRENRTEPERHVRAFFDFARRDVLRAYYSTPEARAMLGYRPPREGGYPDA